MQPEIGKYYVFLFANTGIIGRCLGVEKSAVFFQTRFGIVQRDTSFDRMAETPRPSLITRILKGI
jgi:hypothetical protein